LVIVPELPEEQALLEVWLSKIKGSHIKIQLAETPELQQLLKMAENNAWLFLKHQNTAQGEELTEVDRRYLSELAQALGLPKPPRRIEGYDISNISGQDAVGSEVVFINGHPFKKAYRRYRIKGVKGPNDFAMLQEVLFRRLKKIPMEKETEHPDLIVVDGGIGQVSAGLAVLKDLNLDHIPLIGLAKKEEEIYLPRQNHPVLMPSTSGALKILTRLRDEAHRFAVNYHRRLRNQRMQVSILDEVKGLGPEKRKILLRTFGSVESLLQVSVEELAKIKGIGLAMAQEIQNSIRNKL
jgi:excinuclease ABC subunit C